MFPFYTPWNIFLYPLNIDLKWVTKFYVIQVSSLSYLNNSFDEKSVDEDLPSECLIFFMVDMVMTLLNMKKNPLRIIPNEYNDKFCMWMDI